MPWSNDSRFDLVALWPVSCELILVIRLAGRSGIDRSFRKAGYVVSIDGPKIFSSWISYAIYAVTIFFDVIVNFVFIFDRTRIHPLGYRAVGTAFWPIAVRFVALVFLCLVVIRVG